MLLGDFGIEMNASPAFEAFSASLPTWGSPAPWVESLRKGVLFGGVL